MAAASIRAHDSGYTRSYRNSESLLCESRGNAFDPSRFVPEGVILMLVTDQRRPAFRTLRGWAIMVLHEARAIRECEVHGWIQDRADPHASTL